MTLHERDLPDGRRAYVYPLITGTVRVGVGDPHSPFMDDQW